MSIISEAIRNIKSGMSLKQVWDIASTKVENDFTTLLNHDSTLAAAVSSAESTVKQGLSDAISVADSALAPHAQTIAQGVETALETALAAATGGASVGLNPIISAGIDDLTNIAVTAAHAYAIRAKAALASGQAITPVSTASSASTSAAASNGGSVQAATAQAAAPQAAA